jgi:uncharacterized protein
MKDRDPVAVEALRTVLGAIDNAEAVPSPEDSAPGPIQSPIASATQGVGAGDVPRRDLSDPDVAAIVRAEVDDLRASAEEYHGLGRDEPAKRLGAQADMLETHLSR